MTTDLTLLVRVSNPKTKRAVVVVRRLPLIEGEAGSIEVLTSIAEAAQEAENKMWIQGTGRKWGGPQHSLD